VPFFAGQLVVGAAAGLLVSVVVQAEIIQLGGGGGLAALGFVVGFSEAAFLGLITRIGEPVADTPKQSRVTPRSPAECADSDVEP
jgi:hypothetical protein